MQNGNTIECILRKYRIRTPEGIILEIVNARTIKNQLFDELLEEASEISSFFEKHQIKVILPEKMAEIAEKIKTEKEKDKDKDLKSVSPIERLNLMLQMRVDFTRVDYQEYLTDKKISISNFMGHGDIQVATKLNRIEEVGKTDKDHPLTVYRVIDTTEIDKDAYNRILEIKKGNKSENKIIA